MSFIAGSIYILVDARSNYYLFIAGASPNKNPNMGTIYLPDSNLKSLQQQRQMPMSWPNPPVLSICISSFFGNDAVGADNYVNRIVVDNDTKLPPTNVSAWWFSLMNSLYQSGIIETQAHQLSFYVRSSIQTAMQNYQMSGACTSLALKE